MNMVEDRDSFFINELFDVKQPGLDGNSLDNINFDNLNLENLQLPLFPFPSLENLPEDNNSMLVPFYDFPPSPLSFPTAPQPQLVVNEDVDSDSPSSLPPSFSPPTKPRTTTTTGKKMKPFFQVLTFDAKKIPVRLLAAERNEYTKKLKLAIQPAIRTAFHNREKLTIYVVPETLEDDFR